MEFSWGFISIIILIIFPGLLFRRLYYYGQFSKQFGSGLSLIKLLAVSAIPGLINLILVYIIYEWKIDEVDFGKIMDNFKDLSNPGFKYQDFEGRTLRKQLIEDALPFVTILYISSFILGVVMGRLIRITGLDIKFKLIRFKNKWFYLFHGHHTKIKKQTNELVEKRKLVLTMADILVDSSTSTHLYSGIIVDYELEEDNNQSLKNIVLRSAKRYKKVEGKLKRQKVNIPGNLLVVDCSNMINLNLTFVYEKKQHYSKQKFLSTLELLLAITFLISIPLFFIQIGSISWNWYQSLFSLEWYQRLILLLALTQTIGIIKPEKNEDEEYVFFERETVIGRVISAIILGLLFWFLI